MKIRFQADADFNQNIVRAGVAAQPRLTSKLPMKLACAARMI
jgi:hypothetical protein